MALTAAVAVSAILDVINNKNKATQAFSWLQEVLHEIQGIGRWRFTRTEKQRTFAAYLPLPTDFDEAISPIILDTATAATGDWVTPTAPWVDENFCRLTAQKGDFRFDDLTNITFHSRWTVGKVLLRYYRKITIPSTVGDTASLDLPEEFVYRICVYGAARYGLIGEDDFERLNQANLMFENAKNDMIIKYGRSKVANEGAIMGGSGFVDLGNGPGFPSNYSIT